MGGGKQSIKRFFVFRPGKPARPAASAGQRFHWGRASIEKKRSFHRCLRRQRSLPVVDSLHTAPRDATVAPCCREMPSTFDSACMRLASTLSTHASCIHQGQSDELALTAAVRSTRSSRTTSSTSSCTSVTAAAMLAAAAVSAAPPLLLHPLPLRMPERSNGKAGPRRVLKRKPVARPHLHQAAACRRHRRRLPPCRCRPSSVVGSC